jgi:hypothetical protein
MSFLNLNIVQSYDNEFQIQNLRFDFDNSNSTQKNDINPGVFGYDSSLPLVSGSLAEQSISLSWDLLNPNSQKLYKQNEIIDAGFSGFLFQFYDLDKNLLLEKSSNSNSQNVSFDLDSLKRDFLNLEKDLSNDFYIHVLAKDSQGRCSTGIAYVEFPDVSISKIDIFINKNPFVNISYENSFYVKSVDFYLTTGFSFNPEEGEYLFLESTNRGAVFNYKLPDVSNFDEDFSESIGDNSVRSPYFVHIIPHNYISSGQQFTSSGIKPVSADLIRFNQQIYDFTGNVFANLNEVDKNLNLTAFLFWKSSSYNFSNSFEIFIEESGNNSISKKEITPSSPPAHIERIIIGSLTGSFELFGDEIFYASGDSGIFWNEHTLTINNWGSLPTGFYDSESGIPYIREIIIPSGFSSEPEIYLNYYYDSGSNDFVFYPSGGLYDGNVYTGTYSSDNLNDSSICLARRFNGSVYSIFDGTFSYPLQQNKNYSFKVRTSKEDGLLSDYSEKFFDNVLTNPSFRGNLSALQN